MKIFRIALVIVLLTILFLQGLKIYSDFNNSRELKKEEKNRLKKSAEVLNNCFDLENKSKRSVNDSMKLIEYCLKEYGSDKKKIFMTDKNTYRWELTNLQINKLIPPSYKEHSKKFAAYIMRLKSQGQYIADISRDLADQIKTSYSEVKENNTNLYFF